MCLFSNTETTGAGQTGVTKNNILVKPNLLILEVQ